MIRELQDSDVAACVKIVEMNWGEPVAQRFLDEVRHAFMPHITYHPTYYVYEHKKKVVAFAGMMPSCIWHGLWEFIWINVHPKHVGKNIGTKLTKHRIHEVMKRDGTAIHLMTREKLFFVKLGFEEIHYYKWGDCSVMSMQLKEMVL